MHVLVKVQVFKEIIFNKKKSLLLKILLPKNGSFCTFLHFWGYFPMFMKNCLLETNFHLYKREEWYGNSSIRIKLFCFKKAYFCNFTKFLVVLTQPTCPVRLYCTSCNTSDIDGTVAEWYQHWTVPLHAHRVFVCRVRYRDVAFFSGFPLVS